MANLQTTTRISKTLINTTITIIIKTITGLNLSQLRTATPNTSTTSPQTALANPLLQTIACISEALINITITIIIQVVTDFGLRQLRASTPSTSTAASDASLTNTNLQTTTRIRKTLINSAITIIILVITDFSCRRNITGTIAPLPISANLAAISALTNIAAACAIGSAGATAHSASSIATGITSTVAIIVTVIS
jgi:hypothetical protein